jgi:hypothetical protein
MSEPLNQLSLTRRSDAYWRVTFNHPPINLLDDNTVPELEHLLELAEAEPKLKVIVFDSANPDFFILTSVPPPVSRTSLRASRTDTIPGPTSLIDWRACRRYPSRPCAAEREAAVQSSPWRVTSGSRVLSVQSSRRSR